MNLFEDIKLGLEQAIEYEKGNIKAKSTTLSVAPLHGALQSCEGQLHDGGRHRDGEDRPQGGDVDGQGQHEGV